MTFVIWLRVLERQLAKWNAELRIHNQYVDGLHDVTRRYSLMLSRAIYTSRHPVQLHLAQFNKFFHPRMAVEWGE